MNQLHPWSQVGFFLKEKRVSAGLTQKQLAEHFGLTSPQYVSNWERGLCPPPTAYLPDLCKILHISEKQMVQLILDQAKMELHSVFRQAACKR